MRKNINKICKYGKQNMIYLRKGILRYFIEFLFLVYFISSMTVLRDEMYTRQTHIRDRFTAKPAVVTYN
jgi:hypothetical protein